MKHVMSESWKPSPLDMQPQTQTQTLEQRLDERDAAHAKPPRQYKTSPARRATAKRWYRRLRDWVIRRVTQYNLDHPEQQRKASREYQERHRLERQARNHKRRVERHEARMKALVEAGGGVAADGSLIPAPVEDGRVYRVRRM